MAQEVTTQDLVYLLGAKEVELTFARRRIVELEAQVVALTPKPEAPHD